MRCLKGVFCSCVMMIGMATANAAMVAHWGFDEGSGTTAYDSVGSNDGTLHSATWVEGKTGGALSFNSINNAYVTVPDSPATRYTQSSSFTIAFWALSTPGGEAISKMRESTQFGNFGYEVRCSYGMVDFRVEKSGYAATDVSSDASFDLGQWYHVVAVYNNKSMKVYVNGVIKASGAFEYDTGSTSPDGPLVIGTRGFDGILDHRYDYNGRIDDLRFYNEELSANSIQQLYATTPEPCTMMLLGLGGLIIRKKGSNKPL